MHGEEGSPRGRLEDDDDDDDENDDMENVDSQKPCQILGGESAREKVHVLVVKQRQPEARGSNDYEIDVHRLYLSPGENALILKETAEPSILMDTQEEANMVISYVLSFEQTGAPFMVNSEQYLYFDVMSTNNIVTIKDFRTPPSPNSSPCSRSITDNSTETLDYKGPNRTPTFSRVGIASKARPSHFEELPFRQLRVLEPGDRISTNMAGDRTGGDFILEYVSENLHDPPEKHSLGLLTQPQDLDDEDDQTEVEEPSHYPAATDSAPETQPASHSASPPSLHGPPPRHSVEEVCTSLLTQPEEEEGQIEDKEEPYATVATAPKDGNWLPPTNEEEQDKFHDNGDEDSEMTVEMTQQVGMILIAPQTSQAPTDPTLSIPVKELDEDVDDEDSETQLGDNDQFPTKVDIHPPESITTTVDSTPLHQDDVVQEYRLSSPMQAFAHSTNPAFQDAVTSGDDAPEIRADDMSIDKESAGEDLVVEGTDCVMASPKESPKLPAFNPVNGVQAGTMELKDLTEEGGCESLSTDGLSRNKGPDAGTNVGNDAHSSCKLFQSGEDKKDATAPTESSSGSQSLHAVAFLPPSQIQTKETCQIQTMKTQDMLSPALGTVLPISPLCEVVEAEDDVTGSGDLYEIMQKEENSDKVDSQQAHSSFRNLLASPSQDVSISLLRETGTETPVFTGDCQNISADTRNETEEQHDADDSDCERTATNAEAGNEADESTMIDKPHVEETQQQKRFLAEETSRSASRGVRQQSPDIQHKEAFGDTACNPSPTKENRAQPSLDLATVVSGSHAQTTIQSITNGMALAPSQRGKVYLRENEEDVVEAYFPSEINLAHGHDGKSPEIANITESHGRDPGESTVAPNEGLTTSGDVAHKATSQMRCAVDMSNGSVNGPIAAHAVTSCREQHEIPRAQMTPDTEPVHKNLTDKDDVETEMAFRRGNARDDRYNLERTLVASPPNPRSRKRPAKDSTVSPPDSAAKHPRVGSRNATPASSRKSASTLVSTPLSTRKTRQSRQGFSPEEQEEARQISIMGTQAALDHEVRI